jgi:hypothetical protein
MKKVTQIISLCILGISKASFDFRTVIQERLNYLDWYAAKDATNNNNKCSKINKHLVIYSKYGQFSNNLIQLTHGLYLSRILDAALVLPNWLQSNVLQHFPNSSIHHHYCMIDERKFRTNLKMKNSKIVEIPVSGEDLYHMYRLFKDVRYKLSSSSNIDVRAVDELSKHYLLVYASLWSKPSQEIKKISEWIIENFLIDNQHFFNNNYAKNEKLNSNSYTENKKKLVTNRSKEALQYTAAHKRQLEGRCVEIFEENHFNLSFFSPLELPFNSSQFFVSSNYFNNTNKKTKIFKKDNYSSSYHPICNMTLKFLLFFFLIIIDSIYFSEFYFLF